MKTVSQDVIGQILAAEEQAQVLCRVAEERAAEMKAEMKRQGEAHLLTVQQSTAEEYEKKLAEIREGAQQLERRKRAEAQAEATEMLKQAQIRMDRAVKLIVWGIVEKCQ